MIKKFSILIIAVILYSCGNSGGDSILHEKDKIKYGSIETQKGSWTMTAKIDGKDWNAISIMPPDSAGRIMGYYFSSQYISLPYDRSDMVVGKKIIFNDHNAAKLSIYEDADLWDGKKGEMEITKVDKDWAEGSFFFTATTGNSNKTKEITDGFFRISLLTPAK